MMVEPKTDDGWAIVAADIWAIVPQELRRIAACLSGQEVEGLRQGRPRTVKGRVAVLPLLGVMTQRPSFYTMLGGTATDAFAAEFQAAIEDDGIGAVVLDVDSPGGLVNGVEELSDRIYDARGRKPIIAVANGIAASAAYWAASAADEIVVTPSGEVGSIGTIGVHIDMSRAIEQAGLKYTLISAGKYKAEGNPYEPLEDEARAELQKRVDAYYGRFVESVARNRETTVRAAREGYGEGRMLLARQAVSMGLADRVDTLAGTIGRLTKRQSSPKLKRAGIRTRLADLTGTN